MPDAENELTVAIIEDDRTLREGLAFLIGGTPDFRCVGTFGSVEAALQANWPQVPRILLLDINLPGMNGPEGIRPLLARFPDLNILMLSVYAEEDVVFTSLCRGACGYLLKTTPPARLLEAIRETVTGGSPMSPEIARKVVRLFRKIRPDAESTLGLDADLTYQEIRLLQLLSKGHSYQVAADHLCVSINTVRNYIRSVYEKLHVHSKSAAVSKALKARLI